MAHRKGEDLFPYVTCACSFSIPLCVNWSPALTKLLYRKDDLRDRIGVRH